MYLKSNVFLFINQDPYLLKNLMCDLLPITMGQYYYPIIYRIFNIKKNYPKISKQISVSSLVNLEALYPWANYGYTAKIELNQKIN